jgi:DNA-3-methyladenine glycosylase I
MKTIIRCSWAEGNDLMMEYHDKQWGVEVHDDQLLFEMLNLEGAQAGLSWLTILKKRDAYRKAFDNFDAKKIAKYTDTKKAALMQNEGIVRNRLKIAAVVKNAIGFLAIQKEFGTFDKYIWSFKDENDMSSNLKKRGFTFVGPTICYAFMQAIGMVNGHTKECFRYKTLK